MTRFTLPTRCAVTIGIVAIAIGHNRPVLAQEPLARARTLYAAAAYEEALAALGADDSPQGQQYRALCLLAIGRTRDAERTVQALIESSPTFLVSDEDTPPRFVALVARVRQTVLPTVLRRKFADARAQFQSKHYAAASAEFTEVIALTADPVLANLPDAADIRLLASGFDDLAKASTAAVAAPAPAPAPTPLPPDAETPAGGSATPNAENRIARPAPRAEVEAAVAIRQVMPRWPASAGPQPTGAKGVVKVLIGADGRVKNAVMQTSLHPRFDIELLAATRQWRYKPATLRGQPVDVENLVVVEITDR